MPHKQTLHSQPRRPRLGRSLRAPRFLFLGRSGRNANTKKESPDDGPAPVRGHMGSQVSCRSLTLRSAQPAIRTRCCARACPCTRGGCGQTPCAVADDPIRSTMGSPWDHSGHVQPPHRQARGLWQRSCTSLRPTRRPVGKAWGSAGWWSIRGPPVIWRSKQSRTGQAPVSARRGCAHSSPDVRPCAAVFRLGWQPAAAACCHSDGGGTIPGGGTGIWQATSVPVGSTD